MSVLSGPSPTGQVGAAVIELQRAGVSVYWKVIDGDTPLSVACSSVPKPNCVVADAVGAHASSFYGFLVNQNSMTQFDTNGSDTPGTKPKDLNGDGWIDVATEQNDYTPDYATGKSYWQTFQSDGNHLTSTGCTVPTHNLPPVPTKLVTGACPTS